MNLLEEILALLKAQFSGVREDGLQQLAAAISLQVENKEEAAAVVGKLTADKVAQFVKDYRSKADAEIGKANKTYEEALRKKYDFKEKQTTTPPPTTLQASETGAITLDQIKQLIHDGMQGVQTSITSIAAEKVAETRKGLFVAALDKAKVEGARRDMFLKNFDRLTFKDDDDFNSFITEQETQFAAIAQEEADKGLLNGDKPIFGAVNKDGISAGVASYIAEKTAADKTLTGKEI